MLAFNGAYDPIEQPRTSRPGRRFAATSVPRRGQRDRRPAGLRRPLAHHRGVKARHDLTGLEAVTGSLPLAPWRRWPLQRRVKMVGPGDPGRRGPEHPPDDRRGDYQPQLHAADDGPLVGTDQGIGASVGHRRSSRSGPRSAPWPPRLMADSGSSQTGPALETSMRRASAMTAWRPVHCTVADVPKHGSGPPGWRPWGTVIKAAPGGVDEWRIAEHLGSRPAMTGHAAARI